MSPWIKIHTLAERYDLALFYMHDQHLQTDAHRPMPTKNWPPENIKLLEGYRNWLLEGGVSEMVTNVYHVMMAGHVFGLTLKPYKQLDPDTDLECAMDYVKAKGLGVSWTKNCRNSLVQFRRFLRLERGLGEEKKVRSFAIARRTDGLPPWLVSELERYQHLRQRNWRAARLDHNIRSFWSKNLDVWRFLVEKRGVQHLADVKRQFLFDFVDDRLAKGRAVSSTNGHLRYFHSFLLFLQDEGYSVPQTLLRIPGLKLPDSLPKYLTDEQVKALRDEIERCVRETQFASRLRQLLLVRAAFYLLWQGGLRVGEVEELRLEDLDFQARKLTVRNGKGFTDRTVWLNGTVISALTDYLAVRGKGSSDHVFLFRNAPLGKDMLRDQLKYAGQRAGVHVYPHRLRHTCATQLLNAGCRITSIQRFLGHKKLNTTMIYARAHDQNVADDYFAAMQRVEQRLDIISTVSGEIVSKEPDPAPEKKDEVIKVQDCAQLLAWVDLLSLPELPQAERLLIAAQMKRELAGSISLPVQLPASNTMQIFEEASP
jgi:site-specific recombinase XerD